MKIAPVNIFPRNFNVEPKLSSISEAMTRIGVPAPIHGSIQGAARAFPGIALR